MTLARDLFYSHVLAMAFTARTGVFTMPMFMNHLNLALGWALMLLGLISGGLLGLFFHREDFLGSYAAWPRRLLRLGHIAFMALGMLNVIYALCPHATGMTGVLAAVALAVGSITMPLVCLLAAWRSGLKCLFVLPVVMLAVAMSLAFWSAL